MPTPGTPDFAALAAPDLAEFERMADAAFAALPSSFRALCGDLVIRVADFAEDEALRELGLESEFDLLGLFQGIGLAQASVTFPARQPNMIWLYRRPILDFWAQGEDTLGAIVTHVLVHEIGHHFGLSDEDIDAIEAA
jgi:predicted Zn-dependent protease with MMP-like domain